MQVQYEIDGNKSTGNLMIEQRQPFLESLSSDMLVKMMQVRPVYSEIDDKTLVFEVAGFVIPRPKVIVPGSVIKADLKQFKIWISRSLLNSDPDTQYVLSTVENWLNQAKQKKDSKSRLI